MKTMLLHKDNHRDLRVATHYSADLGDGIMAAATFAAEFRNLHTYYPILFQQTADKKLFPVALLGLEQGENLFLNAGTWDAGYVPLMVQKGPFSIGLYPPANGAMNTPGSTNSGDLASAEPQRLIHVDLDHPKVNDTHGARLFEEFGTATPYLERVSGMLEAIHVWHADNEKFMAELTRLDLLEPVNIDITLGNGTQGQLIGFHTLHEERLKELPAAELHALNQKNYLLPIYLAIGSLVNIQKLIDKKSRAQA